MFSLRQSARSLLSRPSHAGTSPAQCWETMIDYVGVVRRDCPFTKRDGIHTYYIPRVFDRGNVLPFPDELSHGVINNLWSVSTSRAASTYHHGPNESHCGLRTNSAVCVLATHAHDVCQRNLVNALPSPYLPIYSRKCRTSAECSDSQAPVVWSLWQERDKTGAA